MPAETRLQRLATVGPREVLRRLAQRGRQRLWLDEEHVWYQLDLSSSPAAPWVDHDGLTLRPASGEALDAFAELPTMEPHHARRLVADGGEPWIVMDGDAPAFVCWLYRSTAPVTAAPRGRLRLPEGAVVLEDSVAAERARGRGIAPMTWRALASTLQAEGRRALLTKVETGNAPSRRAVTKAGFREVGVMRLRRRGPASSVDFRVLEADSFAAALRDRLARRRLIG